MADGTVPLVEPSAELLDAVARQLRIVDHGAGGEWRYWIPNAEQRELWEACEEHERCYALKPRQIGATTAVCLADLLFVVMNEALGHVVRVGLVWDTDPKAVDKLELIALMAGQLGIACDASRNEIRFPGGSKILAFSAGGKRAGASLTFHRLHMSELPHWRDAQAAWTSLEPALVRGGRVVIETTMGLGQPIAVNLWRKPGRFHKVFFSVEQHEEYREDPVGMDAEVEAWLVSEGFTNRRTMAFLAMKLEENGGDRVELLREFPRTDAQAFASADGRWIKKTPPVLEHRAVVVTGARLHAEVDPVTNMLLEPRSVPFTLRAPLKVFVEPKACSGQVLIGVDTGGGVGKDGSTVAVTDKRDGRLLASFKDNECTTDDLADVAMAAWALYHRELPPPYPGAKSPAPLRPEVLVEVDGMGITTLQALHRRGCPAVAINTTEATRYAGLLAVKVAIEGERLAGPKELADEADGLHTKDGMFKGPKDLAMAIGFCLVRLASAPFKPVTPPKKKANTITWDEPRGGRGSSWT